MSEWLVRRREFRLAEQPGAEGPPAFGTFYDVAGESIAAVVHTVLGAGVAVLMASWGQVSGGFATFAVGASAPLILVQLKHSRLAEVLIGDSEAAQPAQSPVTGSPDEPQVGPRRPAPGRSSTE
ncbi:hypothetical protein [Streptomyces sp. NPDC087300]|uniref:hypothetical protein n=1 Tax=Streptomyces sp. NPDC087300 TaxID=3365780 RepID=UPI00382CD881